MPIYEYACTQCGKGFETLVRSDTKVVCPACQSARVERRMSVTARPQGGSGGPDLSRMGPPSGGCGGGGCGCH